ncbi:MAG TPA: hypothetical protein VL727_12125 [Puia sp.]|jgi:hypothetical protein|nr:hypothetical protein [Puia sp.]
MKESFNVSGIPGGEALITRKSFNYYLTITVIPGLFLFFLLLGIAGRLNILGSLFCFLFFGGIIYAYFGRYLAEIRLYEKRIEVQYIFPWNHPMIYTFNTLTEVDHNEMPGLTWTSRWYRSYQILYLKNDNEEVCQIRYNINESVDEILVDKIRRQLA